MIGLLQRVNYARVRVDGEVIAEIQSGLLVLVGVERADTDVEATRLIDRLVNYRVFSDDAGRMNRSLRDTGGGLLLVPQFTLPADTRKGRRPSFGPAADPETGKTLFAAVVARARECVATVETGLFGADMAVALENDGPVTFWLEARAESVR